MCLVAGQQNITSALDGSGQHGAVFFRHFRGDPGRKETTERRREFDLIEQTLKILQRPGKLRLQVPAGFLNNIGIGHQSLAAGLQDLQKAPHRAGAFSRGEKDVRIKENPHAPLFFEALPQLQSL
jgi:hypothetical protein